jgi:hypothetical protein
MENHASALEFGGERVISCIDISSSSANESVAQ